MDDLLSEFLTETSESLDVVDAELVKFEQNPNNADILDNIFRLVHTIKGTCGFLGLPRLESLAHAAETLMGKFRDGVPVTSDAVTLILESIDRIKEILAELEAQETEPEGADSDLIEQLDAMSAGEGASPAAAAPQELEELPQILERELKPGEVSLEELERVFNETPGPDDVGEPVAPEPEIAAAPAEEVKAAEPAPVSKPSQKKPAASEAKKESAVKNQSIRVNVDTLEHLMTTVSELVLTRNQLLEMVRRLDDSEFKVPLQRLSNVTAELQEGVMKTRMQPIGNAWQKLPRIVRDLSKDLDKKIELVMNGAETELDRQVLELIKDPLTHMVRNSADHGLETTEGRLAAGKPETGKITLSAYHEGGHIIIDIADDGRGLNADKITAKVIERGLATEDEIEQMSEAQIHKFVFNAGFSTAAKVTNVSGRGVGMDVVRTNIELIGGNVDVKSVAGKGSVFTIKIPLTLAIVSALIVESAGQRFAVPQLSVVELVRAHSNSEHRIEVINNTPVLRLRNKLLPLVHLNNLLNIGTPQEIGEDGHGQDGFIIVTQVGAQNFGIVVDGVFDNEEIVVKPMSSMLRDVTMFSGNTILGDGSVILIIDPNGIAQAVATEVAGDEPDEYEIDQTKASGGDGPTTLLLFRAGSNEPRAVPLSLITRLEEIDVATIERSNGHDLVQYRGTLTPLVYMAEGLSHKESGLQPILIFSDDGRTMGLVVDEIVDIVETSLDIELKSDKPGTVGTAVIKEKATEIIDVAHYLPQAFEDWFERKERGAEALLRRKLLLVDDSAFFRNMLAPVLTSSGFSVTTVASAVEALRLKEDGARFDVIVSDIEMPEMNGFQFAREVKEDGRWATIPMVALSSDTRPQSIERAREIGFHDYVGKFDREGLIETLHGIGRSEMAA